MRKAKYNAKPIILLALFIIYLVALFKITILRDSSSGVQSVNLIPFTTIAEYFQSILSGNKIIGISNLLGNLIIFFPLGYISASLFPKMRKQTRILTLSFAFSLAIEIFQYILACGAADIDDMILNILGGLVGYWLYAFISRITKRKKYEIFVSASLIALTCIGFIAFNNYRFLLPMVGDLPARSERRNENFRESFTIDEQPDAQPSISAVVASATQNNVDKTHTNANIDSTDEPQSKADETEWYLILVNRWNTIPDGYKVELTELSNGQLVDKRIYPALQDMFDAAKNEGVYPIVASGYRTAENQQILMNGKIAEYRAEGYSAEEAISKAEAWVAIPGTSEHQSGIAVDINADGIHSAGYEVYDWLNKNAYKYGFICRYPTDKTEITGVIYEPWHYRYVGVDAATEMYNQSVCFEEYLNGTN